MKQSRIKNLGGRPKVKNLGGRPKGSKSKPTTAETIKRFEANQLDAATVILEIMNDPDAKSSERLNAAKYVIKAPFDMRKDLRNEGKKDEESEEESEEEEFEPLIYTMVQEAPHATQ